MEETPRTTKTPKQRAEFLLVSIRKIAAAFNVTLSEATQSAYMEALAVLSEDQLTAATAGTVREWREASKMPTIRFILDQVPAQNAVVQSEAAWDFCERLVKRSWYADGLGWQNGAQKQLTPAMQYAIRQAGDEHRIAYVPDDERTFVRRAFLEAFAHFSASDGAQVALSPIEAKRILADLSQHQTETTDESERPL